MKFLVLILTLVVLGCHMPDEILVSSSFLPKEEEMVQDALDEWEEALDLDTGIVLYFGWTPIFKFDEDTFESKDGKATMHIVERYDDAYQSIAFKYDENYEGYTRYLTTWSIVVVRQNDPNKEPELNEQRFRNVLLHEFGHYMGHYKHKGDGLMTESVNSFNPVDCIDQATVERMCGSPKWNCGPNAHSTCD